MNRKNLLLYCLTTSYAKSKENNHQFVHVINKALCELGVDIKTVTPSTHGAKNTEKIDGILIKRFRYLPKSFEFKYAIADELRKSKTGIFKIAIMVMIFFIYTINQCLKERPDFLHGHWAFPGGYVSYLISKIFKIPYLVTIHGGEISLLKKFNFIRKPVIKALNKSRAVVANSSYVARELETLGVSPQKIKIIRVPISKFGKPDPKEILEFRRSYAENGDKIILFVGRLVELKGVRYLIESIKKIESEDIFLIIVGDGPLRYELEELAKQLNLHKKITFTGWATRHEVSKFYDISDVFVCPSIVDSNGATEGLGLVIPEAMAHGIPVIGSNVGGIPDTIKDGMNGILVEPKNSSEIAEAIQLILKDESFSHTIIQNSKKTVEEFSSQKIALEYYKLYNHNLEKN